MARDVDSNILLPAPSAQARAPVRYSDGDKGGPNRICRSINTIAAHKRAHLVSDAGMAVAGQGVLDAVGQIAYYRCRLHGTGKDWNLQPSIYYRLGGATTSFSIKVTTKDDAVTTVVSATTAGAFLDLDMVSVTEDAEYTDIEVEITAIGGSPGGFEVYTFDLYWERPSSELPSGIWGDGFCGLNIAQVASNKPFHVPRLYRASNNLRVLYETRVPQLLATSWATGPRLPESAPIYCDFIVPPGVTQVTFWILAKADFASAGEFTITWSGGSQGENGLTTSYAWYSMTITVVAGTIERLTVTGTNCQLLSACAYAMDASYG